MQRSIRHAEFLLPFSYPKEKETEDEDDLFVDAERKASAKENS